MKSAKSLVEVECTAASRASKVLPVLLLVGTSGRPGNLVSFSVASLPERPWLALPEEAIEGALSEGDLSTDELKAWTLSALVSSPIPSTLTGASLTLIGDKVILMVSPPFNRLSKSPAVTKEELVSDPGFRRPGGTSSVGEASEPLRSTASRRSD